MDHRVSLNKFWTYTDVPQLRRWTYVDLRLSPFIANLPQPPLSMYGASACNQSPSLARLSACPLAFGEVSVTFPARSVGALTGTSTAGILGRVPVEDIAQARHNVWEGFCFKSDESLFALAEAMGAIRYKHLQQCQTTPSTWPARIRCNTLLYDKQPELCQ